MPQYMDQNLTSIVQSTNTIIALADSLLHPCFYEQWAELEVLLSKSGKKLIVTTIGMEILKRLSVVESSLDPLRKKSYRSIYKSLLAKSLATNPANRTVRVENIPLTSQGSTIAFTKFLNRLLKQYPRICVFTQSPDLKTFLLRYEGTHVIVRSFIKNTTYSPNEVEPEKAKNTQMETTPTKLEHKEISAQIDETTADEKQSQIERILWTDAGEQIQICERINGGAEGAIHKTRNAGYVAKIYHVPPNHTMCSKLTAMVQLHPALQHIAYPISTLRDTENKIVGVLLPHAMGRQLSVTLSYDYKTDNYRLAQTYPYLNSRTFMRIAKSVATQIDALHRLGIIVGDINLENVLVDFPKKEKGQITTWLMDVDSVQFRDYPCRVERPEFVHPRYLQNPSQSRSYTKSREDDNFALSVLIFMTLMRGARPYQAPRTEPEDATRRCQFPYVDAAKRELFPPNSSIRNWNQLPSNLQIAFCRAFFSANQNPAELQIPSPLEWVGILETALRVSLDEENILRRKGPGRSPLFEERKDGKIREDFNPIVD